MTRRWRNTRSAGLREVVLTVSDGAQIAGDDLYDRVKQAQRAKQLLQPMSSKLTNAEVAEQAAVLGAFNQVLLDLKNSRNWSPTPSTAAGWPGEPADRGWTAEMMDGGGIAFLRTRRVLLNARLSTVHCCGRARLAV